MENNQYANVTNIFNSPNYIQYIVEYIGNFDSEIDKNKDIYITLIDNEYAIASIKKTLLEDYLDNNEVRTILEKYLTDQNFRLGFVSLPQLYTLQEISAIEAAQVSSLQANVPLNLTGSGVIVGIIDTGIDYLNEEFMDMNGETRIEEIWDQTIPPSTNEKSNVPFGTIYTKDQINEAIKLYKSGGDPYSIVPSVDKNGHGTAMAGIVGATGKNIELKGVAPECKFVAVKLAEANFFEELSNLDIPVYNLPPIMVAVGYLRRILFNKMKPVVILLPLGSNNGNHKGDNVFDSFIESVSGNVGIVIVTGTGNEALQDGHVSGVIKNKDRVESIGLLISEDQINLSVEIWVDLPNIIDISVVSPAGEETGFVQAMLNMEKKYSFILANTTMRIAYYLPEEYSGEELISINFRNITSGLWTLKLRMREGEMATYNSWIMQSGIVSKGTRFTSSDPYGTITIPGDSDFIVTMAAYNQNNNSLLPYSGIGFREENIDKIDVAAGGVNTKTVGLDNSIATINGTSLSAAIGAGACILLLQWGIVQGKYPYMYVQSIKTFIRRGVIQRPGDLYPNPNWGYGVLNFYKMFENMT